MCSIWSYSEASNHRLPTKEAETQQCCNINHLPGPWKFLQHSTRSTSEWWVSPAWRFRAGNMSLDSRIRGAEQRTYRSTRNRIFRSFAATPPTRIAHLLHGILTSPHRFSPIHLPTFLITLFFPSTQPRANHAVSIRKTKAKLRKGPKPVRKSKPLRFTPCHYPKRQLHKYIHAEVHSYLTVLDLEYTPALR
jgi:hypothetical protein